METQEHFYEIMYGWIESRNTECEVEHTSGFNFAQFINNLMEATQK